MGYSPKLNSTVQRCYLFTADKESACNAGDSGSIPGLGRSPGERIAWKIPRTEEPWPARGHGSAKGHTQLTDSTSLSSL